MNDVKDNRAPASQATVLMLRPAHPDQCVGCGFKLGTQPRRAGAKFPGELVVQMLLCPRCSADLRKRGELHTRLQRRAVGVAALYRAAPAGHA